MSTFRPSPRRHPRGLPRGWSRRLGGPRAGRRHPPPRRPRVGVVRPLRDGQRQGAGGDAAARWSSRALVKSRPRGPEIQAWHDGRRGDTSVVAGGGVPERFGSRAVYWWMVRESEERGRQGVGPRGFRGFNGHDTHWNHCVVPMPGAMRPSRPRCARERAVPEPAQWLAPRADPRAWSALRVRPRTATRAPCPCTPRERPALSLTGDRHARMGLRGAPTRRGEAPLTHRRSRIQPRGRAPCTAH